MCCTHVFQLSQATADIRSDIAELRSVVASGSGASPDAALSRIETAIADQARGAFGCTRADCGLFRLGLAQTT